MFIDFLNYITNCFVIIESYLKGEGVFNYQTYVGAVASIAIIQIVYSIAMWWIVTKLVPRTNPNEERILDVPEMEKTKRTDFTKLYRHCVATIAEGYKSADSETFGRFLLRHADHLSKYHKYPRVGKNMAEYPIKYCYTMFRDCTNELEQLLHLFYKSEYSYVDAREEALSILNNNS